MIIIGYQGIGKSTLSNKEQGFIDLESGCFWNNGERIDDWFIYYCQVAEHLSAQGYIVFVSSHKSVRDYLKLSNERVICIYPSILLADEWKKKLHNRYRESGKTKDYKAWMNAENMYHENISDLMMCGIPHAEINHMDYNLLEIIKGVINRNSDIDFRAWKVRCGGEHDDDLNHQKGKWISHRPPDGFVLSLFSCDQCGYVNVGRSKYCPNCGARMDRGEQE